MSLAYPSEEDYTCTSTAFKDHLVDALNCAQTSYNRSYCPAAARAIANITWCLGYLKGYKDKTEGK